MPLAALVGAALCLFLLRHASLPGVLAAAGPDAAVAGLKPKFADVNGIRTRYYEMGQGEPMLLVHGGDWGDASSANDFSPVLPVLAKTYHVYALDRLGRGLTDNPKDDSDYNNEGEAEFLHEFITTMKLGPVIFVGHDSGGPLGLYMAVAYPESVKALVMVAPREDNPATGALPNRFDIAMQDCPEQPFEEAAKCKGAALSWLPGTFDADYWEAAAYIAGVQKSVEAVIKIKNGAGEPLRTRNYDAWRQDMWARVQNDGVLQMPALIYAGRDDAADWSMTDATAQLHTALEMFDVLGAKNPKVQMTVMNNAGHYLFREHPAQFADDLAHFINYWEHAPALQPRMVPMPAFTSVAPAVAPQGGVSGQVPAAVAMQGASVYTRYCARCHEDSENGAPSLDGLFATTKLQDGDTVTDEHVGQSILKGSRIMPAFEGQISQQDLNLIIQYLHTR